MMSTSVDNSEPREIPKFELPSPNPLLRNLDKLVGRWAVWGREHGPEGEISGEVTFEWTSGGFFLKQEVCINHLGHRIEGIELIGYERKGGVGEVDNICTSHYFDNFGNHFEYVWEAGPDFITIWSGHIGSVACFRGRFNARSDVLTGAWKWPGGGYKAKLTKVARD